MSKDKEIFSRFTMMLSNEQTEKLFSARVIIFGIGGVGGAVAHMLVRSGIKNLTVVDFDKVDVTNINRQLVATYNNIGRLKVDVFEEQAKQINTNINIKLFATKLDEVNVDSFNLEKYDYIIDCIDDIPAKKALIKAAKGLNVPILCAMGAGNRYKDIPTFEICDISRTSYDKIAKIIRSFCVKERIGKLKVCYTKQKPLKFDCKTIGSVVYYVINMASVMCAEVLNDIIK